MFCVARALGCILLFLGVSSNRSFASDDNIRASDKKEVVLNKLFPKKSKIELNGNFGFILNQSYVNSMILNGGANYFWSEEWGVGLEVSSFMNKDRDERTCIENFYNQPNSRYSPPCGTSIPDYYVKQGSNYGPAYVPIRELQSMILVNAIWNPVYGKQIMLLSATSYFDVFVTMGAGFANSVEYPKSLTLRNGRPSRGSFISNSRTGNPGASPSETNLYGVEGRPDPKSGSLPVINFGIGQKYHFMNRFSLKAELRNYTLLGTQSGFDNFFSLWAGAAVRF